MGNNDNTFRCFTDEPNNIFPSPSFEEEENNNFGRCKMASVDADNEYSSNFKIKELYPDCYLNLCNKEKKTQSMERVVPNNYNGTNLGFQKFEINKTEKKKSIADFLKI